jgi:hypothetical protein
MPRIWLSIAMAIAGSACAGDDASTDDTDPSDDDGRASVTASVALPDADQDICGALPGTGPCSLLCDRDALVEQYVPANTCAVFVCELDDGRRVTMHACHPPD